MKAKQLFKRRITMSPESFVDLVAWELGQPVPGSAHKFKYRLAFVVSDACVLRYDNEAGKGDHKHIGDVETDYVFVNPEKLVSDFLSDVERWQDENRNT